MSEPWIQQFLGVVFMEIGRMWWIFLLSALLVGLIKGYKLDLRIRDAVKRSGVVGVLIAIAVGMVSPLCACGILPVVISLAMIGTPLAPLLAILATSPTMGPDALLLTWQGLGMDWAVLKLFGSALLGLAVGLATLEAEKEAGLARMSCCSSRFSVRMVRWLRPARLAKLRGFMFGRCRLLRARASCALSSIAVGTQLCSPESFCCWQSFLRG